jgi:hypothetical protein
VSDCIADPPSVVVSPLARVNATDRPGLKLLPVTMIVWFASPGGSDAGSTLLTVAAAAPGAGPGEEAGEGPVGLEPPQLAANNPNTTMRREPC